MAGIENRILRRVPGEMRADKGQAVVVGLGVARNRSGINACMPTHDKAQGQNGSVRAREALLKLGQGIKEDVHALVVHFISAGNGENACVGWQFATQKAVGGLHYARTVFRRAGAVYGIIGDNPHIQTVGGDDIRLPPQQHR